MPPPSQLAIATSSVRRLLKEESTYQKELVTEEKKIKDLEQRVKNGEENEDGNAEFILKQHVSPASHTLCFLWTR
jgi:tubulin-specific chaperone A